MNNVLLGASGLRVSEFCVGTATFGEDVWGADREESFRILETYLEAGGRFIDVSNTYGGGGRSEEIVGEFANGRRDELVIGTKYTAITRPGDPNAWGNHRKSLRQSLHTSLKRLKTDHVDLLWMHTWEGLTPLEEIMRALDDEIRAGKVLYVGVSNTPAWAIARANTLAELHGWSPFVGLQTEYSLVSRTPEHELIPMAHHLGLSVLAWSPLAGGVLAGGYTDRKRVAGTRYRHEDVPPHRIETASAVAAIAAEIGQPSAAVALAWLRQRPLPVIPMLGARTSSQLKEILTYLDLSLDEDCLRKLDELTAPPPIMPREGLDTPDVDAYFHGGVRDSVLAPSLATYPHRRAELSDR
jgi:aryl-alcohol dehydrogenase-like predicted oxidoreductase